MGGFSISFLFIFFVSTKLVHAASFSLSPSGGKYEVGSTFNVTILINTEGQNINAVEASLSFPPDKLQLVSPSAGNSIIGIYTIPPRVNNQIGRVDVAGGILGGFNAQSGQIATVTFRVKAVGTAVLRFLDNSKILLNDGQGTNALNNTGSATYELNLPAPNGPLVVSESHPSQDLWYRERTALLRWSTEEGVEGYSYTISSDPVDLPQDIVQTRESSVIYKNLSDGNHYFHIKALRKGVWGGTTHYSLKIDGTPPAVFPVEISPSPRTNSRRPVINLNTTDALSGIDRYELKLVSLDKKDFDQQLFIEVQNSYIPDSLDQGSYDVIARAYDKAGNYIDITQRLEISDSIFRFINNQGLFISKSITISWVLIWSIGLGLLVLLIWLAIWIRRWAKKYVLKPQHAHLPSNLQTQLKELQLYRKRYGKIASVFLAFVILGFSVTGVSAQVQEFSPPVISSYSANITEQEIFYVSGRTTEPETDVIIHVQNLYDGQTFNFQTKSDARTDWFYRHNGFLSGGKYLVWSQSKRGDELSAPSPQVTMQVQPIAFSFGNSRVPYNILYLIIILGLFVSLAGVISYIIFHTVAGRKRRKQFLVEIRRAEESIKRGFALLHKDIQAELALVKKAGLSPELSAEQRIRQQELEADLLSVEKYVDQEIWEVEGFEGGSHSVS